MSLSTSPRNTPQSPKEEISLAETSPTANTAQKNSFEISPQEVRGPMNLQETVLSAQTSEPEWVRESASFVDVEELDGTPVKYSLSQVGSVDDFKLTVNAISYTHDEQMGAGLRSHLNRVLGLSDDLESFYDKFTHETDPLQSTFAHLRGLRLMRNQPL